MTSRHHLYGLLIATNILKASNLSLNILKNILNERRNFGLNEVYDACVENPC